MRRIKQFTSKVLVVVWIEMISSGSGPNFEALRQTKNSIKNLFEVFMSNDGARLQDFLISTNNELLKCYPNLFY